MMTNEQLAAAVARAKELDAKRTQGEWERHRKGFEKLVIRTVEPIKANGAHGHIAHISPHPGIKMPQAGDNCNFIAHAPQMAAIIVQQDAIIQQQRDVMRMAREALDKHCCMQENGLFCSELDAALTALDAALKGSE